LPSFVVGHPKLEQARLPVRDDLACRLDDGTFHATAGYGALESAVPSHGELGPRRPRRRAPRLDDGRERHTTPFVAPTQGLANDLVGAWKIGRCLTHTAAPSRRYSDTDALQLAAAVQR